MFILFQILKRKIICDGNWKNQRNEVDDEEVANKFEDEKEKLDAEEDYELLPKAKGWKEEARTRARIIKAIERKRGQVRVWDDSVPT